MTLQQDFDSYMTDADSYATKIVQSFAAFMDNDFEHAVGRGYSVQLFEDGSYRLLSDDQTENRYESWGVILPVPALDDNAEELMQRTIYEWRQDFTRYYNSPPYPSFRQY
jgi:hypothetical protein